MPTVVKLNRYRGDTFRLPVSIDDPDGVAINLTGATIRFTLATPTPVTHETPGIQITRSDAEGSFVIIIPHSVANSITAGRYLMDIEVIYSDDTKETLFIIELTLNGDKTV